MKRLTTRSIIIHHSTTPQSWDQWKTINAIRNTHEGRSLLNRQGETAYHIIIGDGYAAVTRPMDSISFHAGNWLTNLTSVAVCLTGNFQTDTLTKYQKQRLEGEIRSLKGLYGDIPVKGHRAIRVTACPGRNIPDSYLGYLNQLQREITKETYERMFREVWGQGGNERDIAYFMKRVENGSIPKDEGHIRNAMKYWHSVAFPWSWRHLRQMPSEEGHKRWKLEKRKVLG